MSIERGELEEVLSKHEDQLVTRITREFDMKLELHQAKCPYGEQVKATGNQVKGGWKTVSTIGACIASIAALVISWFKS